MKYLVVMTYLFLAIGQVHASDKINDSDSNKDLFDAIMKSDIDALKKALDAGADVNALYHYPEDEAGEFFAFWRPIHMAAYYGKAEIVLMLLSKGAKTKVNINNTEDKYPEHQGWTPIHFTAYHESNDQAAILEMFLNRGLDINEEAAYGWLPLNSAIISDYCGVEGLQRLIDNGANVNPETDGLTPLCWALNYKASGKAVALINAGADLNKEVTYAAGSGDGACSILDVALYEGNNYIARLLIEKGADIDSRTSYGYSRLHWCAMGGNKSMAYYFMKKGLDANEKAENGRTPMSIAKEDGGRYSGLIEVLESGYMSKAEQNFYALVETEEYQDLDVGRGGYKGESFSAKNIKGGTVSLEDYKGKVLFLNIWGTWCPPCVREMPSMQKLYEHMKGKDFAMLASSFENDFDRIKGFVDDHGFTFDVAHDEDKSLVEAYPSIMPTSYIIDKKGNVLAKVDGSTDWSQEKYLKLFDILAEM